MEKEVVPDKKHNVDAKICGADQIYSISNIPRVSPKKFEILYRNVMFMLYIHLAAVYALCICVPSAKTGTLVFNYVWFIVGGYGVTAGAHRLWTHRSYKAKPTLEFVTMLCNCVAFQQTVIKWVRDHRLHHKYSDTDADPHNARRGFFYSHIGWLMVKKSDLVKEVGKTIDISDVENNLILQFQKKYAVLLFTAGPFIIPTVLPMLCFDETLNIAWHVSLARYVVNLNAALLVNSFAHIYGNKPYDKNISPTHSFFVSFFAGGEGFHNYHHVYPWDYRAAEVGNNLFNMTTWFLDFFAFMGWAYDMKTVKPEIIRKRAERTGDGTNCWGFKWTIKRISLKI